jgi:hypothetical protein
MPSLIIPHGTGKFHYTDRRVNDSLRSEGNLRAPISICSHEKYIESYIAFHVEKEDNRSRATAPLTRIRQRGWRRRRSSHGFVCLFVVALFPSKSAVWQIRALETCATMCHQTETKMTLLWIGASYPPVLVSSESERTRVCSQVQVSRRWGQPPGRSFPSHPQRLNRCPQKRISDTTHTDLLSRQQRSRRQTAERVYDRGH